MAFIVSWIVFSTVAMYVRNKAYHRVFAPAFLVAVLLWIGVSIEGILEIVASDA